MQIFWWYCATEQLRSLERTLELSKFIMYVTKKKLRI